VILGWIGLGRMGRPMALRLRGAGHELHVWSRRPETATPLIGAGAQWADDPATLASRVDILFTMLGGPADLEAVLLGERGLLAAVRTGSTIIDCTTSSPHLARRLDHDARQSGVHMIDAPVSGGPVGAERGDLSIMVGGSGTDVAFVLPVLESLGTTIVHHGPAGSGQAVKLANQVLVAGAMAGIVEAFEAVQRLGLAPDAVLRTLEAGIARSPLLGYVWPRLTVSDLAPGFQVRHMIKDLELALEAADRDGAPLAVTRAVLARYRLLEANGYGEAGTQALLLTARGMGWPTNATADPQVGR
jgi:3-hydroxyisobutyrate dehydrogenase